MSGIQHLVNSGHGIITITLRWFDYKAQGISDPVSEDVREGQHMNLERVV